MKKDSKGKPERSRPLESFVMSFLELPLRGVGDDVPLQAGVAHFFKSHKNAIVERDAKSIVWRFFLGVAGDT